MNTDPEPSFELLHLISALLERFNSIQKKCHLDAQQIYLLSYFKSHGKVNRRGQRVLLRANITTIMKEVFKCSDNKVSGWVTKLSAGKFLGDTTLSKDEMAELFFTREGRAKALFLTKEGIAKVAFFVKELEKLRYEITQQNSKLLLPPGVQDYGIIARALRLFLGQFPDNTE
jgi:hypothetical protein